jgi:thioesterase domain-containing protein
MNQSRSWEATQKWYANFVIRQVGEVLVFLGLAKYLPDRPVFALRARGFEKGETFFTDIKEAVTIYFEAIKSKQPQGPYILAGYSYGTMLAFETAKLLEASGDEISFLGSFNLPPHIKSRMRQLDWTECLLHLAYFLSLINVKHCEIMAPQLRQYSKKQAIQYISEVANPNRLLELSLNEEMLGNWVDLSYRLQSMASNYEPSGTVAMIDIFVAEPLQAVAANKEDWRKNSLSKWADFSRSKPRFHDVMGEHYTMIGADHVFSFQQTFRKALEARGC